MAGPPSAPPLLLTIRFTTSLPDLLLTITSPTTTTTLSLKREIRTNLPPETSTHRLRLIHSGKVLPDASTLSDALKLPPPPPQPSTTTNNDPSGKGKAPLRDLPPAPAPQRVYIHCSIGDPLTPSELAAEAAAADDTSRAPPPSSSATQQQQNASSTTTPAPRGFDRLLTAGFTPQEIAALRSQFLDLQSHTHTPDTMPSASELRTLEDRWIDDSTSPNTTGTANTNAGDANDGFGGFGDGEGLEDLLWGNVMGFFWPVGAVVWLLREEGVWSKRRQIAVFTGLLVNVAFSVLRVTS
ncbi:MAG: hypothetical protein M1830_010141 [Pleopsidium flavum]|nr:MAG: hypothetical protein M1830_010141 [Pleopsidium flavum]